MALSKQAETSGVANPPLSLEELALLAREGGEEAFARLVRRCAPMVRQLATRLCRPPLETEDLAQEGLLGLLSAVRTYDSSATSFRTYATTCVRNRILSVVKRTDAARLIPTSELVSISDEMETQLMVTGDSEDPAQLIVRKDEEFRLHGRLRELLSPREYDVLMLYIKAYTYEEIAQQMHISVKSVDNALQRVRRKLVCTPFMGG